MEKSLYGPKSGEGAGLWFLKVISGLLVFFILGLHFGVNHLVAETGLLTYADVVRYYQNPIVVILEIFFLIFVVSHALIGLRGILLDLKPKPGFMKVINRLFIFIGGIYNRLWRLDHPYDCR